MNSYFFKQSLTQNVSVFRLRTRCQVSSDSVERVEFRRLKSVKKTSLIYRTGGDCVL